VLGNLRRRSAKSRAADRKLSGKEEVLLVANHLFEPAGGSCPLDAGAAGR
jgi:hypothetical protein